ncbi:MAG: KR domain-containing protein, partial [Bacteroidota bacterium]
LNAEQLTTENFYGPIYLEQALISEGLIKDLFLLFAVNHLYNVTGEEILAPEKALAVGPARVVGKEHPGIIARLLDLPPVTDQGKMKELANAVISECRLSADETVIAYRHGFRWIEDYTQIVPDNGVVNSGNLRENGVYLITGGVSGIGMELAKYIARTVKATLVLTHRSTMPSRSDWEAIAKSTEPENITAMRVRDIMELESLGAEVILSKLDAADYEGTKTLINQLDNAGRKVCGILHSAGMPGAGVIALKDKEQADLVLKSKVHGTLILHDIFKDRQLDFFFLFSSISAVFGEAARVDYCGSNSFMDSFAQYRKHLLNDGSLSINWGQWGIVGMAANWEKTKAEKKQILQSGKGFEKAGTRNGIKLEFLSADSEQDIYYVDIDPDRDWVLNSHRLSGKPAYIGISSLEILYEYVKIKDAAGHPEIGSLSFVTPLIYDPGISRKVRLMVKPAGEGCTFRISSKIDKSESGREMWMDHVKGDFRILGEKPSAVIDLKELSAKIGGKLDTEPHFLEILNEEGRPVLKYDNRWDCKVSNQYNGKEFLLELKLRDEFADDMKYFSLHPAMLDVATSDSIPFVNNGIYLPFSYRDIMVYHPLPAHFWCYAKLDTNWTLESEEMKFVVKLIDEQGRLLVSFGEVSFKKLLQKIGKSPQEPAADAAPKAAQDMSAFARKNDILPNEGVEVFKRMLEFRQFGQIVINTTELNQDIMEERPSYKKKEKQEKEEEKAESSSTYERPALSTAFEAPSNEIEIAVAGIWKGILGIDKIGINDTFMELGGNSLLAIQTISNIADEFDLELQPNVFFEN